jgi:hypothetical protein
MAAPHRLLRTTVLSAVVLTLAAVAHGAGGAGPPSFGHAVLLAGPVTFAAWFATRRRLAPAAFVAFVVGGQWLLHGAFGALAQGSTAVGHQHGAAALDAEAIGTAATHAHALSASMVLAHSVAALLVALWLSAGERLLWVVVEWLVFRPLAALSAAHSGVVASEPLCQGAARLGPVVGRVLGANVSWRGPPAAAGFA